MVQVRLVASWTWKWSKARRKEDRQADRRDRGNRDVGQRVRGGGQPLESEIGRPCNSRSGGARTPQSKDRAAVGLVPLDTDRQKVDWIFPPSVHAKTPGLSIDIVATAVSPLGS